MTSTVLWLSTVSVSTTVEVISAVLLKLVGCDMSGLMTAVIVITPAWPGARFSTCQTYCVPTVAVTVGPLETKPTAVRILGMSSVMATPTAPCGPLFV